MAYRFLGLAEFLATAGCVHHRLRGVLFGGFMQQIDFGRQLRRENFRAYGQIHR